MPDVVYIEPQVSLGSFLLFDQERIHRNMERGYQDTLKKFDRCLGSIYTFSLQDKANIIAFEERIHKRLPTPFLEAKSCDEGMRDFQATAFL